MDTLSELFAVPEYQDLSYAEQQEAKRAFFEAKVATLPEYSTLTEDERRQAYVQVMDTAPAFKDVGQISITPEERQAYDSGQNPDTSSYGAYKKAIWLHDQILAGNKDAAGEATKFLMGQSAVNASLIGQLAMGASDYFSSNDSDPESLGRDAANVHKVSDYLKSAMTRSQAGNATGLEITSSIGTTLAESLPFSIFCLGSAASKGAILTKGIYQGLENSALEMSPGIGRTLMQTLAPRATESALMGLTEVFRSLPTTLNDSSITGNGKVLENLTTQFGEGVAFDLGLYYAGKAFTHALKPFVNSFRKMDINDAESVTKALGTIDLLNEENFPKFVSAIAGAPESKANLDIFSPEVRQEIVNDINKSGTKLLTKRLDPRTPEGFTVYSMLAQHDCDFIPDGKIQLSQFGVPKYTASSMAEANDYIAHYLRVTDAGTFANDAVSAAMGTAPELNVKIQATAKNVFAKDLPNSTLISSIRPNVNGEIQPKNIKVVADTLLQRAGIPDAEFNVQTVPNMQTFYAKTKTFSGNILYVPAKLTNTQETEQFTNYLHTRMTQLTQQLGGDVSKLPDFTIFKNGVLSDSTANPTALQSMVKAFGGDLQINAGTYSLQLPGNNAPQSFHSYQEVNRALSEFRLQNIPVTRQELETHLARIGRSLVESEQPGTGVKMFEVRGLDGFFEANGASIEQLMTEHPLYMPKLPEYLAPRLSFVGKFNKVRVISDLASGTESDLRKMLDSYELNSAKTARHLEHVVNESTFGTIAGDFLENTDKRITLELPEIGFRKTFNSLKEAKKFMDTDINNFSAMERIANERGIRIDPGHAGTLIASDKNGRSVIIKSNDQLKKFLAEYPDPSGASEFFRYSDTGIPEDIAEKAHQQASQDFEKMFQANPEYTNDFRLTRNLAGSFVQPMNDTIHQITRLAGDTTIPEERLAQLAKTKGEAYTNKLRGLTLSKIQLNLNNAEVLKAKHGRDAESIMARFLKINGKQLDKETSNNLMKLIETDESTWKETAKTLGMRLTPEHVQLLHNTKSFLDYYGKVFNVDMTKMFTTYGPKIRATMRELYLDPKVRAEQMVLQKQQIIHQMFGAEPDALRTVEFFAKHGRLEAFVGEGDNKNLVRALKFYIDNGLHEKYARPVIEQANNWFKNIDAIPTLTEDHTTLIKSWLNAISGETLQDGDKIVNSLSDRITRSMAQWMEKRAQGFTPTSNIGKFFSGMADEFASKGALEMMNSAVTYSTLGARPIRGLLNMMQFNNTIGVFGHYADEAMEDLMSGGILDKTRADELVQKYFKEGVITGKVFASGHSRPHVEEGILETSMRNQQNSEYWTRAATALTVEKNFNDILPYYAEGKITAKQFLKYSNLDFLDLDAQKNIMGLLAEGKPEAALLNYKTEAVRVLMGDYDASNYPMAFKGAVGKLFGRFGVYPINQVALYNRIASHGDFSNKAARIIRFLTVTTATYEAFKAVGLNYTGFLATDPFSFSGGPLFKLGEDVLNSRQEGVEGSIARANVVKGLSLMVPFSSQAKKMLQAFEAGNRGNYHEALIDALSGQYTADNLLTPMFQ